ncbi:LysR family transcriptional regulator [Burkholderia sp. JSH-S8]|nr:LysR family transcriptional regulator [Burkholderia sp. JSH-S8]
MYVCTSDLDLRLIKVFLAVLDARGITAAEAMLGVRQSTISTQLAMLEARVGFRLCERGRGGFRLTSKGERFAASARNLIGATSSFVAEVREMDRKLVGTLNVGLIGNTALRENTRMVEAISAFRKRDQAVRFSMVVGAPHELEEGIVNNKLDIALGYFWHRVPGLEYVRCFVERQIAYCGRTHPLFHFRRTITMQDAAAYDWVWRTYPLPEERFAYSERQITATADNIEAAALLILSGGHLGYLPEHYAEEFERRGLLKAVNKEVLSFDVEFHFAMKRASLEKPILRAFCDDLWESFQESCTGDRAKRSNAAPVMHLVSA